MTPPFYVRLQSGLYLNLSQIIVIHPRQSNGSIRIAVAGSPLIVISPVTDEDEQRICTRLSVLDGLVLEQIGVLPRDEVAGMIAEVAHRDPNVVHSPIPSPKPKIRRRKKSKNGRRRPKVAA